MRVLVIRFSSLGDIIMTSPAIRWLSQQLSAEVHFLTKKDYKEVVKFNPYITKIQQLDNDLSSTILKLKKENYDVIIDLHNNRRSRKVSKSLCIKTFTTDKEPIAKWLYLITRINRLSKKHIIQKHLETLSSLNITDDGKGMDFFIDPNQKTSQVQKINKPIVFALGGTYETKRIPISLINSMPPDIKERSVLLGGNDVKQGEVDHTLVQSLIGKTSLHESAQIIMKSEVVITGDTGMMHLACALQKPTIVIWGSTGSDWGFFPYYGKSNSVPSISINQNLSCQPCSKYGKSSCPKGHMNCLKSISSNQVTKAITSITSRS